MAADSARGKAPLPALLDAVGPPLQLAEVRRLVEAASPSIRLEGDTAPAASSKGRYLVARRNLAAGAVVLSERPLFRGSTSASHSSEACSEAFAALADSETDDSDAAWEDCLHPRSPLVDCVAAIVLAKRQALQRDAATPSARASLRLRQLAALCRADVSEAAPEGAPREIFEVLRPELREITSEEELHGLLHVIGSNRFCCGDEARLNVMFAGSMFEHSCVPNCFVDSLHSEGNGPQIYRTLREVKEGEALSLDYIQLPDSYLPKSGRARLLRGWGFTCACSRCTELPEITCSFVCPACGAHELCPRGPTSSASASDAAAVDLACNACHATPDSAYAARCLATEAALARIAAGEEGDVAAPPDADKLLGRFHHGAFHVAWSYLLEGVECVGVEAYAAAAEDVAKSIRRLYGGMHPSLLEIYHTLAEFRRDNLEEQQRYLAFEHEVTQAFYPEDAEKQDAEILRLIHGPRFSGTAPWDEGGDWTEEGDGVVTQADLEGMD